MRRETRLKPRSGAVRAERGQREKPSKPRTGSHNGHAPKAAKARHGHTAGQLTRRPQHQYGRLLEAERLRLSEELEALNRRAAADADVPRTGATGGEDDAVADAVTHTLERDRDCAVESNLRDLLDEVDQALTRLRQGTYGTCGRCQRAISALRLRAIPYATLCITCKEEQERGRSRLAAPFREWRVFTPPKEADEDEIPEKSPRSRRTA